MGSCEGVRCGGEKRCVLDAELGAHCVRCGACSVAGAPVCAVDGRTYAGACALRRAACERGKALPLAYRGSCIGNCHGSLLAFGLSYCHRAASTVRDISAYSSEAVSVTLAPDPHNNAYPIHQDAQMWTRSVVQISWFELVCDELKARSLNYNVHSQRKYMFRIGGIKFNYRTQIRLGAHY